MRKNQWRGVLMLCGAGLATLAACQLIRPSIPNLPVTAELQAPAEVKATLKNSCYNCHSNEVDLPLYDRIAPAYWLVAHDVRKAREHLNFSEIAKLPKPQQEGTLFEAINLIQLGAMPLPRYLRVHPHAVVTPVQLQVLRAYAASLAMADMTPKVDTNAADAVRPVAPSAAAPRPAQVKPSLNGIAFIDDYKNWVPVSSTDRWDNWTLRQILGNEVAQKALAEGHINPWPDGSTFAKVAWKTTPDGHGGVKAGQFFQVEFMIRDSAKYKNTEGWGWARWRGTDLKPYGKDANLADECIGCHLPVRNSDFVYTMPLQGQR